MSAPDTGLDRIVVSDLLLRGILGINPDERESEQEILVNFELWTDIRRAAETDDISDAVNYRSITKRIIGHVESSSDHLVEKLVTDLARLVLSEFAVERVTIRVEKPGALRFARSVGVEITRDREDFGLPAR